MTDTAHSIPSGFLVGGISAGIKASGAADLAMIVATGPAVAAGMLTTNRFCAAPVLVCRERLAKKTPLRGVIANAGNANAVTGKGGLADARAMAEAAERAMGAPRGSFLVASTGVIGKRLPMEKILGGAPQLAGALAPDGWDAFSRAIMTTDTKPKLASRAIALGRGKTAAIIGAAKGVGMIQPNVATMLAFLATDFPLSAAGARKLLARAADDSFNCLTVDGQMSTNDTVLLFSSAPATRANAPGAKAEAAFAKALLEVAQDLTRMMAADGEGATKLVSIEVSGARNSDEAKRVAREIGNSPLVKSALFGELPNWGRIAQAAGQAGVAFDPARVSISLQGMKLVERGQPTEADREELRKKLGAKEIRIEMKLGQGKASGRIWTCDLTYEYVKINTEYN